MPSLLQQRSGITVTGSGVKPSARYAGENAWFQAVSMRGAAAAEVAADLVSQPLARRIFFAITGIGSGIEAGVIPCKYYSLQSECRWTIFPRRREEWLPVRERLAAQFRSGKCHEINNCSWAQSACYWPAARANAQNIGAAPARGWLSWRGRSKNVVARKKVLPATIDPKKPLLGRGFSRAIHAGLTANGRLYIMGYLGDGADLAGGHHLFRRGNRQTTLESALQRFTGDTIYHRYATSSPAAGPRNRHIYMQGTQEFCRLYTDGKTQFWNSLHDGDGLAG